MTSQAIRRLHKQSSIPIPLPMAAVDRDEGSSFADVLRALALITIYIFFSTLLISTNKFVLQRFPYPLELTSMHMSCSWALASLLYLLCPSFFPGMARAKGRKLELLPYFIPLGFLFAVALFTSNKAYMYSGVVFLQFMKESNVVIVFLLSCAVGLQRMERVKAFIVLWVLAGATLCVHGEMHFVLAGFLLQVLSQLAECSRNVIGEFIMSGTDFKLDPLTYTMFMAPVTLCFLLIAVPFVWEKDIVAAAQEHWHYLVPNALLAFCLNVTMSSVLKYCSAMGFTFAGLIKDITIVVFASFLFGETVTATQCSGFLVTLSGIAAWSVIKLARHGLVSRALSKMLCVPIEESKGEMLPLAAAPPAVIK